MDNYFTSLSLLTHLGVNKILATGVLNKIGYANAQSNTQAAKKKKKKGILPREQRTSSKKAVYL